MKIKEIVSALERFAPLPLQDGFDNAGLQVGLTDAEATGALLCLDVTEAVLDEAIALGYNLVISHHPLIFKGYKSITGKDYVERCILKAIKNDIVIYSAHTNLDNAPEGVNFKIAEKIGLKNVRVLEAKEFQTLEIELCEKRIKEFSADEEVKSQEAADSTAALEERQKDLEVKKNELDEIISETKQEEEKLRDKAKELETKIEPRLLQSFKRIRKNSRNGLGIVYVQRDACGGCFNKIPPQRQLDIRSRKKIIVCEYCGRIMIDPELAGIAPEVKEEPVKEKTTRSRKKAADAE